MLCNSVDYYYGTQYLVHAVSKVIFCYIFGSTVPVTGSKDLDSKFPSYDGFNQFVSVTRERYPALSVTSHMNSDGHWASTRAGETMSSPLASKAPVGNPQMLLCASHCDPTRITFKFQAHFILLYLRTCNRHPVSTPCEVPSTRKQLPQVSPVNRWQKCFESKSAAKNRRQKSSK